RGVLFRHLDSDRHLRVTARCVLDGTDLGDLLPLAQAEYVTGFESRAATGEPDAPARARPDESQPFSYAFVMSKERQPAPPVPGRGAPTDPPATRSSGSGRMKPARPMASHASPTSARRAGSSRCAGCASRTSGSGSSAPLAARRWPIPSASPIAASTSTPAAP